MTILMTQESCDLQGAADRVGRRFADLIAGFEADKARLPSWGVDFAAFVKGLETWVVGNCQWSLETQRYFGVHVEEVKRTRVVKLDRKRDVGMVGHKLIVPGTTDIEYCNLGGWFERWLGSFNHPRDQALV